MLEEPFLRERLERHGVEVVVPDASARQVVDRVIFEELVLGIVRDKSREAYREVMGALVDAGAEGVVLGCTEIELLVGPDDVVVPTFPTTALHAEAAVDFALGIDCEGTRRARRRPMTTGAARTDGPHHSC